MTCIELDRLNDRIDFINNVLKDDSLPDDVYDTLTDDLYRIKSILEKAYKQARIKELGIALIID